MNTTSSRTGRRRRGTRIAAAALMAAGTLVTAGAASAAPAHKPGLISSDWLTVVKETGEWNGDEPVMLTLRLESVLGQPGTTNVTLVNPTPAEIASGVDAGDTVRIPDREGDAWFGTPALTADAVLDAAAEGKPLPIPVVVTATVMLEGDMSNGAMIGAMGHTIAEHLQRNLAAELADTKIVVDGDGTVSGLSDAIERIEAAAAPDSRLVTDLVLAKISDWATSVGDPDDPVGVSLTALIPVDESLVGLVGSPSALGLDSQYLSTVTHQIRTTPFDTDVEVRTGLLVPPAALGGNVQQWTTTYKGDYVLDDPVDYRVATQAWPQITW